MGNGHLGLRPYGVSLCKSGKVTKTLLPLPLGASLWLGIPSPQAKLGGHAAIGHPWPCRG